MLIVVAFFAALIVAISGYGLVSPPGVIAVVRWFQAGPGVWAGFVIRLVFAVALWLGAPLSATPSAFRVLAVVAFLGAVALPLMGSTRFDIFVEWWVEQPAWLLRVWFLVALAFGLFALWSSVGGLADA
jgi:hypothetical protein